MERTRRRKPKKRVMTRSVKQGLRVFLFCIVIIFVMLIGKIYGLNKDKGDTYKKHVLAQQSYVNSTLEYRRGEIKDRNQTTLAVSSRVFHLILEPRTLKSNDKYLEPTLEALAKCFSIDREVITKRIADKSNSLYEEIQELKNLSPEKVDEFKEYQKKDKLIQGVWFKEGYIRKYPLNTVACDIIGFTSGSNVGMYGIEEQFNEQLNGREGRAYGYFDSELNLQRTVKPAVNGSNMILTIDANVQKIVEDLIADYQKTVQAKNIAVMLMDPKTGEVLAMASDPVFDLNKPRDLSGIVEADKLDKMNDKEKLNKLMETWSNYCVSSAYEPGSTFKPFTIAAALDEGKVTDSSGFTCTGKLHVGDRDIKCANIYGHGDISLGKALMESCNVALMDIGFSLGRDMFSKYNELYGFGKKTGITLPGEASGQLHIKEQLNPVELATSSFGQTQTVTMIQMMAGFCSLINGGNYYQPQIVKEVQNEEGAVVQSFEPILVKKTTTEKTSKLLRKYLLETVETGSAQPAKVKGYSIGGKTGTAEKRPVSDKNYLLSFIGSVPAKDPRVAIYVIIDQPNVEDQAHSNYATEFSAKILKKVLPFLGVYSK